MALKVIVDTSAIHNEKHETFLGGRYELERFLKFAYIIIPDMVIEEIKSSKRRHLQSEQTSFLSNSFHSLMQYDENETQEFDIESFIHELKNNEDIPYTPIRLTNYQVIEEMKELALHNNAPFDIKTDKGFKDAYIYFTILEYLQNIDDKQVFFLTNDSRLKEAFKDEKRIIPVTDFKEFFKHTAEYFSDDYFLEQLRHILEETEENVTASSIKNRYPNKNGDWVLKISAVDNKIYNVIVDFNSKEITGFMFFDFSEEIETLIHSDSFQQTHTCIHNIKNFIDYFSIDQIEDLIVAKTENIQISWIEDDEDVKEFFQSIYESTLESDD